MSGKRVDESDRCDADFDQDYLRRSSTMMLECAVSLMLSHMNVEDVLDVLRTEIEILQEHG